MKVALGSDHAGLALKKVIVEHLRSRSVSLDDFGVFSDESADYPDTAALVATAVQTGESTFGILVCGTGIGMSVAANKHKNIRAALCSEPYSAKCAREHNDANILALGSRTIGTGLALDITDTFLSYSFSGGRHQNRIAKIHSIEEGLLKK